LITETHALDPQNGIAKVREFVVDVAEAGAFVGQRIPVEITEVYKTFAKARLLEDNY